MDSFYCRSTSSNSASTASEYLPRNVVRSEEITMENFDKSIDNWKIPKRKEITLPDEWVLEGSTQPELADPLTPNSHQRDITQYQDGKGKELKSLLQEFQDWCEPKTDQDDAWIFANFSSKPPEWIHDRLEPAKHVILLQCLETKYINNYISGGGYKCYVKCYKPLRDQINRWRARAITNNLREGIMLQNSQQDNRMIHQNQIYKIYIELNHKKQSETFYIPFNTDTNFPELVQWYKTGEKEELARRLKEDYPQSWWKLEEIGHETD
ncbi:hypothetical protein PHJA_002932100 [Phtheirospermum japonicum]|uniref:Uncharacterized protein n=1 Tax=Phtheirospermum japonicum TaxID=374723 RepID=A0A830D6Y7_9LAMI|nr:hypothetical protein PHJA_002932100 [Phtheirospermum japonicum]